MPTAKGGSEDTDVVHEVIVKLDDRSQGSPAAWTGLAPPGEVRALDAHHHMLHEASVLSSHLRAYQKAVTSYSREAGTFFDALTDFLASTGDPALYENTLTPEGMTAARAAAAAAAAAGTGVIPPDVSAAAGVQLTTSAQHTDKPTSTHTGATGVTGTTGTTTTTDSSSTDSAFAPEAAVPRLPLLGPSGVSPSGVPLCPGVPLTAALGVKGGLTKVVPAELNLPEQHATLFSTEHQRQCVALGRDGLAEVLRGQLEPTLTLWLDTYEECKSMLPQVERLRAAADKARAHLDQAMADVMKAEAKQPLVHPHTLTQAGLPLPRVLVRAPEGTMLTAGPAAGGGVAAAAAVAGGAGGAGELVAAPALKQREEMYKQEQAETDASLSYELAEVVLRDRLRWLMIAGAGLKAMLAAALAHALGAAAGTGGSQGLQADPAGPTGQPGGRRAPLDELLSPFPQHVLARLQGDHLPTLPHLVTTDQARLQRWAARYKDAMAAQAAATAAAAGAQMMAAAASPTAAAAAAAATSAPRSDDPGTPSGGGGELFRTDKGAEGGPAAGTAAVLGGEPQQRQAKQGRPAAAAAAPAGAEELAEGGAVGSSEGEGGGGGSAGVELRKAAAASGMPLDLLAAAVAADVQEQETAAAKATKADIAWRLLHDASLAVGKEQAVLLPEVSKAVPGVLPGLLADSHRLITDALSALSAAEPTTPAFDLAVLEVVEALDTHNKLLSTEVLPALEQSCSRATLCSLAASYRRAAASAPTRPHSWLLSTDAGKAGGSSGGVGGAARHWLAAAGGLVKAPVRAGVALADAAADAAHFGVRQAPLKA